MPKNSSTSLKARQDCEESGAVRAQLNQILVELLSQKKPITSYDLADRMKPGDFRWRYIVGRRLPELRAKNLAQSTDDREIRSKSGRVGIGFSITKKGLVKAEKLLAAKST